MSRSLARNIYHLMRGAARRTTVDELRKQGRKTVSVLNFRDVQDLIEKAVENTLKRRGIKMDGKGIHEEVRLEFLALMRERDLLQKTVEDLLHEKERLAENREKLDRALTAAAAEYKTAERAGVDNEANEELERLSERVLAELAGLLAASPAAIQSQAGELVGKAFAELRATTQARAQAAHQERLTRIDRRMARLKHKLTETEEMLARARSETGAEAVAGMPVEPGLDLADPAFSTKKELLSEIFKLNVELREMLDKN